LKSLKKNNPLQVHAQQQGKLFKPNYNPKQQENRVFRHMKFQAHPTAGKTKKGTNAPFFLKR